MKDLTAKAKTPLGDKNSNVVYNIPCGCHKYSYTGEHTANGRHDAKNIKTKYA